MRLLIGLLSAWLALSPALADSAYVAPTATGQAATGQIPGTATNDVAAAGKVGEVISSGVASSAVSLSIGAAKTLTSISVTAGAWKICGQWIFTPAATTSVAYLWGSLSTTDNAVNGTAGQFSTAEFGSAGSVIDNAALGAHNISMSCKSFLVSTTTIYYLTAQAGFTVSTLTGGGYIEAVRIR